MKVVSQGNRDSGNAKSSGFDGGLNLNRNKNRRVKVIERRPNDELRK